MLTAIENSKFFRGLALVFGALGVIATLVYLYDRFIDDECDRPVYADSDHDGYGDKGDMQYSCMPPPSGYVTNADDCNDHDARVHPGAVENANNVDDDCDGNVDEGHISTTYYRDADADGYGATATAKARATHPGPGWVVMLGDCDDKNVAVNPDATEVCNGIDDDCDSISMELMREHTYWFDLEKTASSGLIAQRTEGTEQYTLQVTKAEFGKYRFGQVVQKNSAPARRELGSTGFRIGVLENSSVQLLNKERKTEWFAVDASGPRPLTEALFNQLSRPGCVIRDIDVAPPP